VCLVSGSKGGTGKSVLSAALSYTLAQRFGPTLLVDLGGGDSSLIALGAVPAQPSLDDVLKGKADPQSLFRESNLTSGLLVAPSRSPLTDGFHPEKLEEVLRVAKTKADYVVLDFPAYTHGPLDYLLERADDILMVATPTRLALERLRSWMETRAASLDTAKLTGILNMYVTTMGSWKRALLSMVEKAEVVYFDVALWFTHTRNIAEAMICCEKPTREKVTELAAKLSS